MRLTAAKVLEGVTEALREQVSPHLDDAFAHDAARMAQALITIVGRAGDDAAAIRVEENARIRAIFAQATEVVADPMLAARLAEAAQSIDSGLRISELDAETGRLRTLLVELHSVLEEQPQAEARALDQEIWRALRDFEMARAPRG
jgi:hypothetical protein